MTIDSFSGEHAFLSNFHASPVLHCGRTWPTVEHAFQAQKTTDPAERAAIGRAATPGRAKRLGRRVKLRRDWDRVKDGIMTELVRAKFRDPELAERLLATGDQRLVEGNHWNDTYWGVCGGRGLNRLGEILMRVRAELREASSRAPA